jgi:hypothetical protein
LNFIAGVCVALGQGHPPMIIMHGLKLLLSAATCFAQDEQAQANKKPPPVDAIMSQVATNQDRSETALRAQYSSVKHIHIVISKPDGKMMREETSDYDIIPTAETRVQLSFSRWPISPRMVMDRSSVNQRGSPVVSRFRFPLCPPADAS